MRIKLTAALLFFVMTMSAAKKPAQIVTNVEPANWFVGMKDPTLQILVTGEGIRDAELATDYPGVVIDSLVRLDSPNYLFVYLNVKDARPGEVKFKYVLSKNASDKKVSPRGGSEGVFSFPLLQREMPGEARKGFSNEDVLYMFMPDRFAQGHADNSKVKTQYPYVIDRTAPSLRHGGDLEGVRQHLDYFVDLGVTALWLTPVLENDQKEGNGQSCYHGYATTNYYKVDPRFGTNEEYRQLVDEAHQKGLKVVMDMIFNHCGDMHPWMKDAPSKDWFNNPNYGLQTSYKLTPVVDPYASKVDFEECVDGWFVESMPDLNQRNPHLMRYLIQNSEWWIETVGIDGIRMDTYPYADAKGMAQWMKTLNTEYPNFNVVGESWVTEPGFTASLQKGARLSDCGTGIEDFDTELKSVMDFTFFDRLGLAKNEETDEWWKGFNRIYNSFVYDYLYPNPKSVLAFLDNHDTDRFLGNTKDTLMLKQGLALLLTINRIPQIYYGTEILMNGTKEITDGYVRCDFPGGFPGDKRNAFTAEGRTNAENAIYNWLSKLLHWRQGNKAITEGKQTQFTPWKGVYVMHHKVSLDSTEAGQKVAAGKPANVLVVINGTSQPATFLWERFKEVIPDGTVAREVTSDCKYNLNSDISLSPRQTLILEY